jgi:predicted acyl esterase
MLLIAVLTALLLVPAAAGAAEVPADAEYAETYIPSSSPVPNDNDPKLHVDVLRPKGAPGKVPTVLTVSPYTNHATQNGADFDPSRSGPSDRFFDYVVRDAQLFKRGYAYVMVDLRGTGGSEGCNDWGGPGEQNDVKRAVEWVASQPWSNGKVALYGKSYDGWTGLMGIAQKPRGLAAVISQEPVVDGYRYLYMNRVRFPNASSTGGLFQVIDAAPGTVNDSPEYHSSNVWANVVKPGCYPRNYADQQNDDFGSEYWKPRNLIQAVRGSTVPTFFMQGFLESNTKPDAVFSLWNNLGGTKNRGWFGQWDHVRGNDKEGKKFAAGRSTFVEETLRFLDEHLKGVAPDRRDPAIVVQASDGKFRSEAQWPPVDSRGTRVTLKGGTYRDDARNNGDGSGAGTGIWSISQALPHAVHLAGMPQLNADVGVQATRANLTANVYDIGPDKKATLVSRGTTRVDASGKVSLELYGQDWIFAPGRRIAVLLSSSNAEWWDHVPTGQTVTVKSATLDLPALAFRRSSDQAGESTSRLAEVRARAFTVSEAAFASGVTSFALPPAQVDLPGGLGSGAPGAGFSAAQALATQRTLLARRRRARKALTVRTRALRRRRILVTGRAPAGYRLTVRVKRGKRTVATRRARVRRGTYRVIVRLRRRGRYSVTVTAKRGKLVVRANARRRLIR